MENAQAAQSDNTTEDLEQNAPLPQEQLQTELEESQNTVQEFSEDESEETTLDIPEEEEEEETTNNLNAASDEETEDENNTPSQKFHNRAIIFVMSGLHKGAGCAITEEITVGAHFNNDLILTDEDINETHLTFKPIEDDFTYAIEVTAKGDNILIDGETSLEIDQSMVMHETFSITIGNVNIHITLHKTRKRVVAYNKFMAPRVQAIEEFGDTAKKYLSPAVILSDIRNIILASILLIIIVIGFVYYFSGEAPKKKIRYDYSQLKEIKPLSIKERANNIQLHAQAKDDLIQVMQKYDLMGRLDVVMKKNIIYVKGRINSYELNNWRKVLSWFDTTYGTNTNLVPLIDIDNGLRRTISFKAVVTSGPAPYVVSWTGDRFKPGATLPGGWIIMKIDDQGVVVKDAVNNRIFLVEHIRARHGSPVPNFRE